MSKKNLKLNLGCGQTKLAGFLGVDKNPYAKYVDIVCDLEVFPYPFQEDSVSKIIMDHVLEHLDNPIEVIKELYRISEPGAIWLIKSPHFSCNWLHPGHKSAISTMLFDYFTIGTDDYYGNYHFKILEQKMNWLRPENQLRPKYKRGVFLIILSRALSFLANINQGFCQRMWCYWVGGFEEISFKVRVLKKNNSNGRD